MTGPALPAGRRRGRATWKTLARAGVLLLSFAVLLVALARRWSEVEPLLGRLSILAVASAAVAVLVGALCSFLSWRAILTDLGSPVPLSAGMRIYFLGQLGKYLPGSIWTALVQMELGRDYQIPRRASAAAAAISMFMVLGVGLLVALFVLPLLGSGAFGQYSWALAVLPLLLLTLYPPLLNRLVRVLLRLARREPMPKDLTLAGIVRSAGWALLMWAFYGLQIWFLARGIGVGGPALLVRVMGAFAGAWAIGFLLVVAPAGVGAREAALILLLDPVMPGPQATVIAVVSRLLFTLADFGWGAAVAAVSALRRRLRREADPSDQPPMVSNPYGPPGD
jgi:hypothetical protein